MQYRVKAIRALSKRFVVASNNPHKLAEFRRILLPLGVKLVVPQQLGLVLEVEETGSTFAENAALKAEAFAAASGLPALADDSGLVVDALGGAPGIRSARYGGPGLSDRDRVHLVLKKVADVPEARRTARFVAAIGLVLPGTAPRLVQEQAEGTLTREPRGEGGFGYDPIFFFPPLGRTFAELEPDAKDRVSHRGKALRRMAETLRELL